MYILIIKTLIFEYPLGSSYYLQNSLYKNHEVIIVEEKKNGANIKKRVR